MPASVEIDSHSGFCGGVIRAIGQAEDYLSEGKGKTLYSLGSIVHNEAELSRLEGKGLVTIGKVSDLEGKPGSTMLIRAHGEPPETYSAARDFGLEVIDCTCPVVLRLQQKILSSYSRVKERDGQIIIFGKVGHAEVLGLVGQVGGDALVIENMDMLRAALDRGEVNLRGPVEVVSQTTKSPAEYARICSELEDRMARENELSVERFKGTGLLVVHDTICRQVASRHSQLSEFAMSHDIIVFVAGKESSNGKVLCQLCKSVNIRTYHVGGVEDLRREWFRYDDKVGVCGATSTPKWLLESVADAISGYAVP